MSIDIVLLALIVLANFFLTSLSLFKKFRGKRNKVFAILVLLMNVWITSSFFESETKNVNLVKLFVFLDFSSALFLGFFFLQFGKNFPKEREYVFLDKILFILSCFFVLTYPLLIKDIQIKELGINVIPGFLYFPYSILILSFILGGIYVLFQKYRKSQGLEKSQIKYVLLGLIFSAFLALVTNLILPRFFDSGLLVKTIPRLGIYGTIFFIASTAYSITKFRFLDIRLALRSVMVRILYITILFMIGFVATYLYDFLPGVVVDRRAYLLVFILVSIFVFIGDPIFRGILKLTDKFFFQLIYTEQEVLSELARTMTQSIDLESLVERINNSLKKVFHVHFVSVLIFTDDEIKCFGDKTKETCLTKNNLLVKRLEEKPDVLILDELKLAGDDKREDEEKGRLIKIMMEMEAQVVFPLYGTEKIIGIVILGEKKSNEAFTINNIKALETLSYQAGIAIENANLYSEVKSFSRKMQQEVRRATFDLKGRNKFLGILRKLDAIIMNTFDLERMCQKIVDTVSWEMGYVGGMIVLVDEKRHRLELRAVSHSPDLGKVREFFPKRLSSLRVSLDDEKNPLVKAVARSEVGYYEEMSEVFYSMMEKRVFEEIQKILKVKTNIVYPISAKGKKLGVIIFQLAKEKEKIEDKEKDLMDAFVDQTGIAVENAGLYSDLKVTNKELEKANVHLTELDKMKDEFVSIASHELRTPMTAIRGYAWMLQSGKHKASLTEHQRDYLVKIVASTERLIELVSDMLDVSRIEGGRIELDLKKENIEDLMKASMDELRPQALEKNIILSMKENREEVPEVMVDEKRIREVLVNLVGNALKFTPEAGKIELSANKKGKFVEVHVKDTGKGISKGDLGKLFKKFSRLENSYAMISETSGTGLGLYISRSYIDMHGGKVGVKSELGKGSDFHFTVRVAREENN